MNRVILYGSTHCLVIEFTSIDLENFLFLTLEGLTLEDLTLEDLTLEGVVKISR
jgi:hypothetical protein